MKTAALLLVSTVLLGGCALIPVKRTFPEIPPSLAVPCGELDQIDENTSKLSDLMSAVIENYRKFHECSLKVDMWKEWYDIQSSIFNEVK